MISEKIHELRTKKGLTVRELADLAGITHSMVSNFENNNKIPGKKVIGKLAKAFDIPELELFKELTGHASSKPTHSGSYSDLLKQAESIKSQGAKEVISILIGYCLSQEDKMNAVTAIMRE